MNKLARNGRGDRKLLSKKLADKDQPKQHHEDNQKRFMVARCRQRKVNHGLDGTEMKKQCLGFAGKLPRPCS
jgi:hypothetical protein